MAIRKSSGVTPTEMLLANLCDKTFLKLWSYPNPYKDDHDELCDILAVFDNHVFVFFDRESQALNIKKEDVFVGWNRWKRKVIDDQTRTAHGAEKYLRSGRTIYLDSELKTPFPMDLDLDHMIVHKIVVAHGAKEVCKQFAEDNIYGSLAIVYGESPVGTEIPFLISIERDNPIHVFDTHNLPIIFGELDTFFDFTAYLDAKIEAIKSSSLVYCGEEDLLAHYFTNFDESANRHYIGFPDRKADMVLIAEGEWKSFIERDEYKEKKKADRVSYLWDDIIQRTCKNTLDGTLLGSSSPLRGKSAIHEMAKEPRFHRRSLSEHMINAIRNFPDSSDPIVRTVSLMPSFFEGKRYLFLQLKVDNIRDYENEYQPKRQTILKIACGAAKNKFPDIRKLIGIAIDAPNFSDYNSDDLLLMECSDWSEDSRRHYEEANRLLGFFESDNLRIVEKQSLEFPETIGSTNNKKIGRNDPCPCGSGKKYKFCCLR